VKKNFPGKISRKDIPRVSQGSIERIRYHNNKIVDQVKSYTAMVTAVYSDKGQCDIESRNGGKQFNVPIRFKSAGLVQPTEEVFGEVEFPAVGQTVIIEFLEGKESFPMITGVIIPYLYQGFGSRQVPVNSAAKQFTKTLLELNKPKTFKKIFPSGTTLEVQEDGSFIVETPSGAYVRIDEVTGVMTLADKNGNEIKTSATAVTINGNLEVSQ
jgi:hypothetical protein